MRGVPALVRSLLRARAYTFGVILTLGLGTGVAGAAVTAIRAIFLEPLPHAGGDRLVYLRHSAPGGDVANALFSVPELEGFRSGVPALLDVAEFSSMRFTALGLDRPREIRAGVVTANYFDVLGLDAVLGRVIGPRDAGERADAVVVLTVPFWERVFGRDPSVVGRTVELGGRSATIVGVAEPHPPYPERTDVYVNLVTSPHHLSAAMTHGWSHRMTEGFARLAPGATVEGARAQVEALAARMRADHPEAYDDRLGYTVSLRTLSDQLTRRARPIVAILLGTAGAVFLVALANVANLVLSRAIRLRGELAVRSALGASARALRARLVAETVLLGVGSAFVGIVASVASLELLASYAARFTVRAAGIGVDPTALLVPAALAVGSAFLLGWLPRLSRGGSGGAPLGGSGRVGYGAGMIRMQRTLVAAQVAASLVLVTGATLLARTLVHLQSVDPGIDTAAVLAMEVPPVKDGRTPAEIRDEYLEVIRALEAKPEIERAALTNVVPFRRAASILPQTFAFRLDGAEAPTGTPPRRAEFRTVTSGYFPALGIPVMSGRGLASSDDAAGPLVAVVNEAFVRAFMESRNPLGHRVAWTGELVQFAGVSGADRTIVGVVADVLDDRPTVGPRPAIYVPHLQEPWGSALVVRGRGDVQGFPELAAEAVRSVVPNQPVENTATLEDARRATFGDALLNARLVGALALVTLLVAGTGVFAALSFSVGRRTREVGIRMALGADRRRLLQGIIGEALAVAAVGAGVGMVAFWFLSSALEGMLYSVERMDPASLLVGPGALLLVAGVAALVPALRATRLDPAGVLADH